MTEAEVRERLVRWGALLFGRGYTAGSFGNLSARTEGGFLVTPTNACLGLLDPERLSRLDANWRLVSGDAPAKKLPLHRAFYEGGPGTGAVVHLHWIYATLLFCLDGVDATDAVPPFTSYAVLRVGRVPVLPYAPPGSSDAAPLVRAAEAGAAAVLLANHGHVVAGASLDAAVYAAEELEESAKMMVLGRGLPLRALDPAQTADLQTRLSLR